MFEFVNSVPLGHAARNMIRDYWWKITQDKVNQLKELVNTSIERGLVPIAERSPHAEAKGSNANNVAELLEG